MSVKQEKQEKESNQDPFQQFKELTDGLWDSLRRRGFGVIDRYSYPRNGRIHNWKETHICTEKYRYRIVWPESAGILPYVNRVDLEKGETETVYGGNSRNGFWAWDNNLGEGIVYYNYIDKPYTTPTTFLDGEPDYTRRERATKLVDKRNEPIVLDKLREFVDEIMTIRD